MGTRPVSIKILIFQSGPNLLFAVVRCSQFAVLVVSFVLLEKKIEVFIFLWIYIYQSSQLCVCREKYAVTSYKRALLHTVVNNKVRYSLMFRNADTAGYYPARPQRQKPQPAACQERSVLNKAQ
jgi:hypothetical protein